MTERVRGLGINMKSLHPDDPDVHQQIDAWVNQGLQLLQGSPDGFNYDIASSGLVLHPDLDYGHKDELVKHQKNVLADVFAARLGMTRRQYLHTLPRNPVERPNSALGEFVLVIVQPPVPEKGLGLEEIIDAYKFGSTSRGEFYDWPDDPGESGPFQTPDATPYITYVSAEISFEKGFKAQSTNAAREHIRKHSQTIRGSSIYETMAYWHVYKPRALADQHAIHCPGTSFRYSPEELDPIERVATVEIFGGQQSVGSDALNQGPGLFIAQFSARSIGLGTSQR